MKTPRHGDIVAFRTKDGTHNYVAIFDRFEDENSFWVSRFLVHRLAEPTLKNNEGDGERACFHGYNNLKVLRRKTLP
jgi:hypothetical protein